MAIIARNIFPNVSRHSTASRAAAELSNAGTLFELSRALTAAGTATATTTSKAKTVNTLTYTVNGQFYTKGATDNFWTLGGAGSATTVQASSFQKYLLLIDTAGAATVQEGVQATGTAMTAANVAWTNISNISAWAAFLTALGATKCCVGVLTIATDSSHTFIPGTTLFGASGITATFIDGIDQSIVPLIANQQGTLLGNGG